MKGAEGGRGEEEREVEGGGEDGGQSEMLRLRGGKTDGPEEQKAAGFSAASYDSGLHAH